MVDGDDDEEFPPKLTRVALMVIVYLMLMFILYPLSDADVYRLSDAWCNQVVYALFGEYV